MSDIREQVRKLRDLAELQDAPYKARIINLAADTIEALYKAADERAEDGWIYCGDGKNLPEEDGRYWIAYEWGSGFYTDVSDFKNGKFEFAVSTKIDVSAWTPLKHPSPYHEP